MNLSGYRDPETILRRLVLDAAALHAALPEAPSIADLGSGAGIPGLPLALLAPDVPVLLVESRLRRHNFQKAARRELGLENVSLLRGRIEELPPRPAGLVVAQAVAPPSTVVGWMLPWTDPGGWLAIPGAAEALEPLATSRQPGLEAPELRSYSVPLGGPQRCLWVARRARG
jgi:16S rRNA (guanine527-N7)-methyltransferase